MNDKTPMYMLLIVGIVAVIAIIVMIGNSASSEASESSSTNSISGNVVSLPSDSGTGSLNAFGKIFFVLFLAGIAVYMYARNTPA